jgi:hypothetical protein
MRSRRSDRRIIRHLVSDSGPKDEDAELAHARLHKLRTRALVARGVALPTALDPLVQLVVSHRPPRALPA